jgi:enoyl-CoA hydratase/carnithine racemase
MRGATALSMALMRKWPFYQRLLLAFARKLRTRLPGIHMLFEMHATYFAIEDSKKITIAAINGACNGCGTEMAACFDFRYMVEDNDCTIGQPEVLVGLVAGGGGTQRVSRLLGKARALEFMLICEQWTPERAKAAGLITDHFPKARFREEVQAIADRISRLSPVAWFEARRAIVTGLDMSLERGLAAEMSATMHCSDEKSAHQVLAEYTKVVDEVILGRPDNPATIHEITEIVNSPRITQYFDSPSSGS